MNFKHLVLLGSIVLITSCATAPTQQAQTKGDKQAIAKAPIALERMDPQFLYLAAQQSLGRNQPSLSVRFLKALVKQKPKAFTPRLELVDLLLASGQQKEVKQAKVYMEGVTPEDVASLGSENLVQYQLLYARSLIANGDVEQAASLLDSVLQKQPNRVEVRLLLARMYAVNKLYDKAHLVLRQGLKEGKDVRLPQMQVQLFLQESKLKQADKRLSSMQQDYPEHEDIVLQRAHLAEKQGLGIKAESLLQLFIDGHEKTAVQSYNMLAGIYVRQNRLDAAADVYRKMLPLTASDADVLMSLGKVHYQQQKYTKARDYFEQAVSQLTLNTGKANMGEELAVASFYYGASLEASHHTKKAIEQYQKLQPSHALYLDAQLRLASIDMTREQLEAAEKRLLTLKKTYKYDLGMHEMLSGVRLQQKRYKDLIAESDKVVDIGYSQILLFNRAIAFEKLHQFEQVDAALTSILVQEPNDAETLNFYGYSLADRGVRLQDAQHMVEAALKEKPNDSYYLDSLAWVLFKKKEYKKALEMQLSAVKMIQDDPVMMEHLGDIYWKAGEAERAKSSWQKAIELSHEEPEKVKLKIERGLM